LSWRVGWSTSGFLVKGEVFRETFAASGIVKMRNYGTRMAVMARKRPTGVVGSAPTFEWLNSIGEVFQDLSVARSDCRIFLHRHFKVRVCGSRGRFLALAKFISC